MPKTLDALEALEALKSRPPGPPRGEEHCRSILTDDLVREIRELHEAGHGYTAIGRAIGVSFSTIRAVVKRRTWAHVA